MAQITDEFVVKSPFKSLQFPNVDLWTFLQKSFKECGNNIALFDPLECRTLTFHDLEILAETVAANLFNHPDYGFRTQKLVVICMTNCIEFVVSLLAVWRLGGIAAVINPLLAPGEIHKQLIMIDPEILICNEVTTKKCVTASAGTSVKNIISKQQHKGCTTFLALYNKIGRTTDHISLHRIANPKHTTALIPFSSGTTGFPKGVEITHSGLVEETTYFLHVTGLELSRKGNILYQPLSHMYGMELLVACLASGQTTVIMQHFDLTQYVKYVAEYKVEILFLVPPIAVQFCNSNIGREYDLSCVKNVLSSAAPLSKELEERIKNIIGHGCKITQALGLTETTCLAFCVPPFNTTLTCPQGSVGWPLCNTDAKVIDITTHKPCGHDKQGEICMKNSYLMKGYLNNPKATSEMIDKEGWLHTGDMGYFDRNGCFFVVDRIKELIKYKGYQVAPAELEATLLTHPEIVDAAVTSVPDPVAGELPYAWVVRRPGSHLTESDIHQYVDERVAPFKRLRGGITFSENIPKSPSGKILRRLIREKAKTRSKL